jgi:hypothetical protein
MPEILAMLDAAIAEVGQKVRASSRSSRRGDAPQADAGTGKLLKSSAVPALPVVPVKNDAIYGGTEGKRNNTRGAIGGRGEVARGEYTLQNTGSTGSTGTSEDSCGVKSSRNFTARGNYGDTPTSGGEGGPAPMPATPGSPNRWGDAEDKSTAIAEYDGGGVREREVTPSKPALFAPGRWFDRFGPPGDPPFDQPCPSRRGLVERLGAVFLHFCVTCGAWGAFGYGVVGGRPGRWYCREHRPRSER